MKGVVKGRSEEEVLEAAKSFQSSEIVYLQGSSLH